jgi:ParB family transcriptional regulator, chromosome partitioning protein
MSEDPRRRGLGRGLSALFAEETQEAAPGTAGEAARGGQRTVPIEQLHPGRFQPRQYFDEESLASLVDSIRAQGILQPLLVRKHPDIADAYEIVAGERRWRAAQAAQLHEVPVVIRELADREMLEVALVENVQRQDLTPLEEAEGYRRLLEEFQHTQEDLARVVGKSRVHITNTMRLLGLPIPVRQMLEDGRLTAGHARALLMADESATLAEEVVRRGLNVRQTERLAKMAKQKASSKSEESPAVAKLADTAALERELTQLLGLKVSIAFDGQGGALTVHYRTLEQLDDVLRRLSNTPPPRPGDTT